MGKPFSAFDAVDTGDTIPVRGAVRTPPAVRAADKGESMESLATGTLPGTGSFRCEECGYVVTLAASDELPSCPGCGGDRFARASLFSGGRLGRAAAESSADERDALIAIARERLQGRWEYLAWRDGDDVRVTELERE